MLKTGRTHIFYSVRHETLNADFQNQSEHDRRCVPTNLWRIQLELLLKVRIDKHSMIKKSPWFEKSKRRIKNENVSHSLIIRRVAVKNLNMHLDPWKRCFKNTSAGCIQSPNTHQIVLMVVSFNPAPTVWLKKFHPSSLFRKCTPQSLQRKEKFKPFSW